MTRKTSTMPLTSITQCYKTLPSYFADKVTQNVKKKRENVISRTHGDPEIQEVWKNRNPSAPEDRPSPKQRERALMTKRSCTPLATVSDNESEDGSTSHDQAGSETQRSNSSAGSKRESPRPMTSGYFTSTLNYIRPRKSQTSPRTAISLDNVDLWEEEDSDPDDRGPSPFDRIEGVPINPRMTLDFSDLRRSRSPVATKRNRLNETCDNEFRSNRTMLQPAVSRTLSEMKSDLAAAKSRLLESRHKVRIRANRKLPATTTFPKPDKPGNGKPSQYRQRTESSEIKELRSPIEKHKSTQSKFQMPPLASTYTFTDSKPPLILAPSGALHHVNTSVSTAKVIELNRINTKIASLRTSNKNLMNLTITTTNANSALNKDDITRVKDMEDRRSTDSNMSTGSSGFSPDRKVKFNNFVTVREGEQNTVDFLRESNNSAQAFKQKYLATTNNNNRTTASKSTNSEGSRRTVKLEMMC